VEVQEEQKSIYIYDERTKNDVRAAYDAVLGDKSS
jgi:hypothetical protein